MAARGSLVHATATQRVQALAEINKGWNRLMSPEDVSDDEAAHDHQPKKHEKPKKPSLTPRAEASKADRAERVAEEMRKNLLKRKQQQRTKQSEI
jgi:hypothetical protein